MTDYLQGPMIQSNAVVQTTAAGIFGNVSVTANSLPTIGIFSPATNQLGFATNSTQQVVINTNGQVGIGTAAPNAQLEVAGSGTNETRITSYNTGNARLGMWAVGNSYGFIDLDRSTGSFLFSPNSIEAMRITGTGLVGIGTNNPTSPLVVSATSTRNQPLMTIQSLGAFGGGSGYDVGLNISISNYGGSTSALNTLVAGTSVFYVGTNGSVGIGTTSPAGKLDVSGSARIGTGSSTGGVLRITSSSRFADFLAATSNVTSALFSDDTGAVGVSGTVTSHPFVFITGNNERMRINSNGQVGIGNSSPQYTLDVNGTVRSQGQVYINNNLALWWLNSSGSAQNILALDNTNTLRLRSGGAAIFVNPDQNYSTYVNYNNANPVQIGDGTTQTNLSVVKGNIAVNQGTAAYAIDAVGIIRASGNIYCGTLNTIGSNILSVTGTVVSTATQQGGRAYENGHDYNTYPNLYSTMFINNGTSVNTPASLGGNGYRFSMGAGDVGQRGFDLVGTNTGQLYFRARESVTWYSCTTTAPSDYRLKTDVQPMADGLARLRRLRPSSFVMKETGLRQEGFIAHELQAIIPEAVLGIKDDLYDDGTARHQSVDYTKLVPLLTVALQELSAEHQQLKKQFDELAEEFALFKN